MARIVDDPLLARRTTAGATPRTAAATATTAATAAPSSTGTAGATRASGAGLGTPPTAATLRGPTGLRATAVGRRLLPMGRRRSVRGHRGPRNDILGRGRPAAHRLLDSAPCRRAATCRRLLRRHFATMLAHRTTTPRAGAYAWKRQLSSGPPEMRTGGTPSEAPP
ncbi:hypothetical protein AQF52_4094 [Streptomyces venezuelae]|nr:hypothetical protein AQF52_4094 [Streptomyces venezuelae]CUM39879.1 hypothetical protein BN2537_8723 [Streptomyces venezuelae]